MNAARPAGLRDDRPATGALRPGDQLLVSVSAEARERIANVDARGELHVAAGRDVQVAGLEIGQAEALVTQTIRATEKDAEVNVHLSPRLPPSVAVFGAIRRPGRVALSPGLRVADVLALRGGVLMARVSPQGGAAVPVADLSGAVLLRDGGALPISVSDALAGKPGHNVYVHPGDQLYVPFATDNIVSVFGQVGAPRVIAYREGLRLTEALAAAGGITPGGDKSDVRLVRGSIEQPKVYRASLRAIADGDQHDVVLASGDVVFVQDHPMEDAGEVLRLLLPLGAIAIAVTTVLFIASL